MLMRLMSKIHSFIHSLISFIKLYFHNLKKYTNII